MAAKKTSHTESNTIGESESVTETKPDGTTVTTTKGTAKSATTTKPVDWKTK